MKHAAYQIVTLNNIMISSFPTVYNSLFKTITFATLHNTCIFKPRTYTHWTNVTLHLNFDI